MPATATAGAWSSPAAVQTQVYPSAAAVPAAEKPAQASWYTRVEYFHWNERIGGTDFVNEDGALFTLGYSRQIGIERFRAELFGGDVHYQGYDQYQATIGIDTMASNTGYLGLRGEYEMVLRLPPGKAGWRCWWAWARASGSATCTTAPTTRAIRCPAIRKPGGPSIRISGWKRIGAWGPTWTCIRSRGSARRR